MSKPAKKYSQAARLHDVIRIMEARYGATVDELAEACRIHRRTVYRDLQAIVDAGYPLIREIAADGRTIYRFLTGFRKIPPITFSLPELMTLYLCRRQFGFLHGTPFQDDLDAIFSRIQSSLPPRSVAHLERIAEAAAPRFQGLRDYSGKKQILEQLREALLFQYHCRMIYAPPRRLPEEYLFDPYTLLFYKDSLYLGGYAHNRGALRLFLVNRLQEIEVTKERFDVPEDFRAEDLTGSSFGLIDGDPMQVRVRFAPKVAHLIRERFWHPGQVLIEEPEGYLQLRFEAGGETEILAWLYSYLPHVQVLEPAHMVVAFRQGLLQALQPIENAKPGL